MDNIHGTWIFQRNIDNLHDIWIYTQNTDNIHRTWIFPRNADNIHRTWISTQNADISTLISTARMKKRNLSHNLTPHLYLLHGTQHRQNPQKYDISNKNREGGCVQFIDSNFYDEYLTKWLVHTFIRGSWWTLLDIVCLYRALLCSPLHSCVLPYTHN